MVSKYFTILFLLSGLFLSSCEWEAVEKTCVPWEGSCEDGSTRGRLVCNEFGTDWIKSDCRTGESCQDGECVPLADSDIRIATTSLPAGDNFVEYNLRLTAEGGYEPYGWQIIDGTLPSGFFMTSDGSLMGTTEEIGTYPITIRVLDSSTPPSYDEKSFDLVINMSPLEITSDYSYSYQNMINIYILNILIPYTPYDEQLKAKGGIPPYLWNEEDPPSQLTSVIPNWGLPPELSIDSSGHITGTVSDTSDANSIQIPNSNTTLTGYFIYMRVTDEENPPDSKLGIFMIPTIPMQQ